MVRKHVALASVATASLFFIVTPLVSAQMLHSSVGAAVQPLANSTSVTFQDKIMNVQSEMKAKLQEEKTVFQQKLQLIKSQQKQTILEDINSRIEMVNQNQTQRMSQALDSLSTILTKVETRRTLLATSGANLTTLNQDISVATGNIAKAKTAVENQAGKTYTLNIVNDATLRSTISPTVLQFRQDMQDIYQEVLTAKQAVIAAAFELHGLELISGQASHSAVTNK